MNWWAALVTWALTRTGGLVVRFKWKVIRRVTMSAPLGQLLEGCTADAYWSNRWSIRRAIARGA
eukprot:69229-Karenia_brevis.AAC.1